MGARLSQDLSRRAKAAAAASQQNSSTCHSNFERRAQNYSMKLIEPRALAAAPLVGGCNTIASNQYQRDT